MQEINWDAMSDHSSDEEIAAELRKAGLSVSCKRKFSSKKTGKENIRKTRVESSTSENVDFSSQKMDKEDSKRTKDLSAVKDVDSIDVINSLPFLENIDGQLYRLEVNEQPSPKMKHVSSANINKKRPRIPVSVPFKVLSSAWSFAASPARTDDREAMIVPKSLARICNDNHNLPITFEEPQSAAPNVPVPATPNDILANLSAQLTDAHESSFLTASSELTTPVILDETKPASKTVVPNDLPVTLEEPQSAASNSLVHDFLNDFTSKPPFTDELGSIATPEDNAYELSTHCFAKLDNGASISHDSTGPEVVIATQVTQRAFDHETDASIVLGPASSGVTVADLETDASIALVSVAQPIPDSVGMLAMPSAAPEAENNNPSTSSLSDSPTLLLSSRFHTEPKGRQGGPT